MNKKCFNVYIVYCILYYNHLISLVHQLPPSSPTTILKIMIHQINCAHISLKDGPDVFWRNSLESWNLNWADGLSVWSGVIAISPPSLTDRRLPPYLGGRRWPGRWPNRVRHLPERLAASRSSTHRRTIKLHIVFLIYCCERPGGFRTSLCPRV